MKHEEKICPRCKKHFECKTGTINQCQCSVLAIADEARDYIDRRYHDCLCVECLQVLQSEYHKLEFEKSVKKALGTR